MLKPSLWPWSILTSCYINRKKYHQQLKVDSNAPKCVVFGLHMQKPYELKAFFVWYSELLGEHVVKVVDIIIIIIHSLCKAFVFGGMPVIPSTIVHLQIYNPTTCDEYIQSNLIKHVWHLAKYSLTIWLFSWIYFWWSFWLILQLPFNVRYSLCIRLFYVYIIVIFLKNWLSHRIWGKSLIIYTSAMEWCGIVCSSGHNGMWNTQE